MLQVSLVNQEQLEKENQKRKQREEKLAARQEKKLQRQMEEAGTLTRREQVVGAQLHQTFDIGAGGNRDIRVRYLLGVLVVNLVLNE